ncbi:MAG: hypothetical protein ABFD18_15110 [Syntrophomonas sp.]
MANVNLNEKEVELLKKSINHCLDTCENKEKESECTDCEALKDVLVKLSKA